jgi:hypothetical protein
MGESLHTTHRLQKRNSTAAPAATAGTSKRGRQAAGGFLIAEEAAGAAALSDHCPRKIQQAAYGLYDNP